MPNLACFIPSCPNSWRKRGCHLFKLPKNVELAEQWVAILKKVVRGVDFDPQNKELRLCSDHFEDSCLDKVYSYLIQGERIERPKRWTLVPGSVPTVFNSIPASARPRVVKPRRGVIRRVFMKPAPQTGDNAKTDTEVMTYQARKVPPPTRPKKFTVETNGKCFMCLEELIGERNVDELKKVKPVTGTGVKRRRAWKGKKRKLGASKIVSRYPVCSLKGLTSYLKMDLGRIFDTNPPLPKIIPEPRPAFKDHDVETSLCRNCTRKIGAFTELLKELEEIQKRLKGSMEEISGLMREGQDQDGCQGQWQQLPVSASARRDLEGRGPSISEIEDDSSNSLTHPEIDLANKFRNELIFKCSRPRAKKNSLLAHVKIRPIPMPNDISPISVPAPTTPVISPGDGDVSQPNGEEGLKKQQEIVFMFQEEGEDGARDLSTDIGRFHEEDLFPRSDPNVNPDFTMMETEEDGFPATPASPELTEPGEEGDVEPVASEQISNSDPAIINNTSSISKGSSPQSQLATKKPHPKVPEPEAPISRQLKCPYCPKTFILQCNIRTHILNMHRFKVFRQHLPPGTGKKLVLTEVKNILGQYKVLEGGKIGCSYCPRRFSKKELELMVVQNHALVIHFNEIVSQLKARITKKTGKEKDVSKTATKAKDNDADDDIIEIPSENSNNGQGRILDKKTAHIPRQSMAVKNDATKMKADIAKKSGKAVAAAATDKPNKPIMIIDVPSDSEDVTPTQVTLNRNPLKSGSRSTEVRIVKDTDAMIFDISSDSEPDSATVTATADVDVPPIPRLQLVQFPHNESPSKKANDDEVMTSSNN